MNWELPGVGEESSLLGKGRWDRLAVPGKAIEVCVGESPGAVLTEAGNREAQKNTSRVEHL